MNRSEQQIIVSVRLFGGLHRPAAVDCMEAMRGVEVELSQGTTVAQLLKHLGLKRSANLIYFVDGNRVGVSSRLHHQSVISIGALVAGG